MAHGGMGWVGRGCGRLLEFLSGPSSLPVLCNWELREGPNMSFFFLIGRYTHTHTSILRMIIFFPFVMSQKKAEGIKFRPGRAGGPTEGLRISEFHQLRQQLGTGKKKKEEFP